MLQKMMLSTALVFGLVAGNLAIGADEKPAEAKKEKTKEVKAGDLTITVPESWKVGEASSRFRVAQLETPSAKGDEDVGEYVVFYFGKGGGGGANANITRWIGQFQPEGRSVKLFVGKGPEGDYAVVDITGTYNKSVGPPIQGKTEAVPGSRMLAAIVQTKESGDFFIKYTGPKNTVSEGAEAFRASFGGDPEKEEEVKIGKKPAAEKDE